MPKITLKRVIKQIPKLKKYKTKIRSISPALIPNKQLTRKIQVRAKSP